MGRAHEVRAASMAKTAAAKSKTYNKHAKEIYISAKNGGADPDANLDLRAKIANAKKDQVPADVIKRAIDKAKGGTGENYDAVSYEGFSQGNSYVMVECLTDNTNRTYSNVRTIFNKSGSKLGVNGCVAHQFKHQSLFSFEGYTDEEVLDLLVMADCDVEDVVLEDGEVTVYAPANEYSKIRNTLTDANPELQFGLDEIAWVPLETVELEGEELAKFEKFLEALEEDDDVQNVYHNVKLPIVEEE